MLVVSAGILGDVALIADYSRKVEKPVQPSDVISTNSWDKINDALSASQRGVFIGTT